MLQTWDEELPKPTKDSKWAPWLKVVAKRVMLCNTQLAKERKRLRGAQVRAHAKKIQLIEE
jgi:hypothetical protein